MHFYIEKKYLLESMEIINRLISNGRIFNVLDNIKIEVTSDQIVFSTSDTISAICWTVKKEKVKKKIRIIESGKIIVNIKWLLEFCRKVSGNEIEFSCIEGESLISIRDSIFSANVNNFSEEKTHEIRFSEIEKGYTIEPSFLMDIERKIGFAVAEKSIKDSLLGVYFQKKDGILTAVASDGFRLSKLEKQDENDDGEFSFVLSRKTAFDLGRSVKKDEKVQLKIEKNYSGEIQSVQFLFGDYFFQTKTIQEEYVDFSSVIPPKFERELLVGVKKIRTTIERASLIKNHNSYPTVRFELTPEKFIVKTKEAEFGNSQEVIEEFEFSGEPLEIAFNGIFISDVLKNYSEEKVKISFNSRFAPFMISNGVDNEEVHIIYPIRTHE